MWLKSGKTYNDLVNNSNSFVTIGDTGNIAYSGINGLIGNVNYQYQISKYEVTNNEYCLFLNSVDPFGSNTTSLYPAVSNAPLAGITKKLTSVAGNWYETKPNMGNKPVNYISTTSMYRYCNWLHNGGLRYKTTNEGANAISTGVYPIGVSQGDTISFPNTDAKFRIPTPSEWFKAAYYDGSGSYYAYATQKNIQPISVLATPSGDGLYVIYNFLSNLELDILNASNDNIQFYDRVSNLEIDILQNNSPDTTNNRVSFIELDILNNNLGSSNRLYNSSFFQEVLATKEKSFLNYISQYGIDIFNNNSLYYNQISYFNMDILCSQTAANHFLSSMTVDTFFNSKLYYDNISSTQFDILFLNNKKPLFYSLLSYDVLCNNQQ